MFLYRVMSLLPKDLLFRTYCPPPFRRKAGMGGGHNTSKLGFPWFRPAPPPPLNCAQLNRQFYVYPFKTLQIFLSWSEDVHVIWILFSDQFYYFFRILNLSFFRREYYQSIYGANAIKVHIYIGYLECATPPRVLCRSFLTFTCVFVMA